MEDRYLDDITMHATALRVPGMVDQTILTIYSLHAGARFRASANLAKEANVSTICRLEVLKWKTIIRIRKYLEKSVLLRRIWLSTFQPRALNALMLGPMT